MDYAAMKNDLIACRRDIHTHPESGWTEFRTTAKVAKTLSELGFDVKMGKEIIHVDSVFGRPDEDIEKHMERAVNQGADPEWVKKTEGYTGVVGILDTKKPGNVTAMRFDIDANDVFEAQDEKHRPYKEKFSSVNDNVMHACGHDGHTTIGLGVAKVLSQMKDRLNGVIKLVFQPAEEGLRGGKAIADSGIIDDVNYIFGAHLSSGAPFAHIYSYTTGFLSSSKFNVTMTGTAAHAGGAPNEGRDALLAAASATVMMHAITPHKDGPTRLNVGVLRAGIGRNVIAPNAYMEVETRGGSKDINDYVYDRAMKILKNISEMYEVSYEVDKRGYAADCVCDPEAAAVVEECAKETASIQGLMPGASYMGGSEDCTWLIRKVQDHGGYGTYFIIGTETAAGAHNNYYDFNEEILPVAVELFVNIARKLNS